MHQGRSFIGEVTPVQGQTISICGWIYYLRVLAQTTFIVVKDCTGILQCVMPTNLDNNDLHLRLDDCVEIHGNVNLEPRSQSGFELHVTSIRKLSESSIVQLPFNSSSQVEKISSELQIENRPLVLRSEKSGGIFKLQASVIELFREYLRKNHFTEIVTSKIVAGGTEGGTNLFQMKYFDKVAYLAQSPQFYKEQGVAGFERVFETGHVYRAEPHATSRHLTEYYSLDVEMGFIQGPEEIIELERGLLNFMFERLNSEHRVTLETFQQKPLTSLEKAPVWEFGECLERLKQAFGRTDLVDDLDGEAERQLCTLAEKEFGVPAVFVLGFPLSARPFYTASRGAAGAAQSFDLLYRGLEITTGGQRLHRRSELEAAIKQRRMEVASFESHLRMFELGMPPHGGFAIGAERLTAQILGLTNVREATLYPRDRNRLTP